MTWKKKIKMPTISSAADPRGQSLSYLFVPNVHFKVAEFGFQVLMPILPFPCRFLPSYYPSLFRILLLLPRLSCWISPREGNTSDSNPRFVALVWIFTRFFGLFFVKLQTGPSRHHTPVTSPTQLSSPPLMHRNDTSRSSPLYWKIWLQKPTHRQFSVEG